MKNKEYDIYCDFDLEKHKAKYIDYLEVIIDANGKIMYAVPSHQEKAITIACERMNVSRRELMNMCPKQYYCDFLNWLLTQSQLIAVWSNFCVAPTCTKKQTATLRKLKIAGVYRGKIPNCSYTNFSNEKLHHT